VRLRLSDVDGADIVRMIKRSRSDLFAVLLLDESEAQYRDAGFRAGCDDVAYAPADLEKLPERLARADEMRYRNATRLPFGGEVVVSLPGGDQTVAADSINELAMRVRWKDAAPEKAIVPIRVALSPDESLSVWAKLEDLATRKGEAEGLILRFVGLSPAERTRLSAHVASLREAPRAVGMLEAPTGAARYDRRDAAVTSQLTFEPLPEPRPRSSSRLKIYAVGVLAVLALPLLYPSWRALHDMQNPSRVKLADPIAIVEGVQVRRIVELGDRYVVSVDATWHDLDVAGKERALRRFFERAAEKRKPRAEVFDSKGRVGIATADSVEVLR
jgi:hypothetical protein